MFGLASKHSEPGRGQIAKPGQKLRLSCDECNKAKVRCTKEKPTCSRCKAQKMQCVYGISLRAGKRAAAQGLSRAHTQPRRSSAVTNETHIREKLATDLCSKLNAPAELRYPTLQGNKMDDPFDLSIYSENPNGIMEFQDFDAFSTSLQPQTIRPYHVDSLSTDPAVQMSDWLQDWSEHDWLASNNQPPQRKASSARQTFDWESTSNSASGAATHSLTCSPAELSSPSSSASSCVGLTTPRSYQTVQSSMTTSASTFCSSDLGAPVQAKSLDRPSKISLSPSAKRSECQCQIAILSAQKALLRTSDFGSTTFDVALAANREILGRCTAFVNCECFAMDDSNVMLLSSIIARMISTYWARASALGRPRSSNIFAGYADIASRLTEGTQEESLALRAYQMDNADDERHKMQAVLVELKKLGKLVQEFQKSCHRSGCASSDFEDRESNNQDPKTLLWRSLVEFLTHKVRSASTELRSRLLASGYSHRY